MGNSDRGFEAYLGEMLDTASNEKGVLDYSNIESFFPNMVLNTEQYEVVFEDSNIVELKNYLTSEGELKAKFTKEGKLNKDTHVYGIPYLYVFGGNENVEN